MRADDVAALLDALGAESADVFGSSGGAVTGLALVARHPGRVRTLVAHEPPLLELLPDVVERRAAVDDIIETFHREGHEAAWKKFMISSGLDVGSDDVPAPPQGNPRAGPRRQHPLLRPRAPGHHPPRARHRRVDGLAPPVSSSASASARAAWSPTRPPRRWPDCWARSRSSSPATTAASSGSPRNSPRRCGRCWRVEKASGPFARRYPAYGEP
ncbi:alpha/beta fold hydrolase [Streptosporangium lutulentum]